MTKFKFLKRGEIKKLPPNCGVYNFKNRKGAVLYVGKAGNIRERVKNHFLQPIYRDNLFIEQVKKIGFIKTNSEIEALILEANLIKKYQPKYNIIWRDDKNYFFVGKTKENYPRVFITHQPLKPKTYNLTPNYVGPFVDGKALKQTLKILRKVFSYRSCKTLPNRPCLWYQLSRCPAPCLLRSKILEVPEIKESLRKEVQRNAKAVFEIIRGKKTQVLRELKKEMKKMSVSQEFEKAAKIRNQITALEKVLAHAKVFEEFQLIQKVDWPQTQKSLCQIFKTKKAMARIEAYDVSNIQGQEATGAMVTFINGQPDKNFYRRFKIKIAGKPNDIAMIKEVLNRRFSHPEWGSPDLILIDGGIAQLKAALKVKNQPRVLIKKSTSGVVALAKKENKLYIENQKKPILLKSLPREVFNLILQLRDEAHRFAITYHRKLREIDLRPKS